MPIPDFQSLMLPLLALAADGQERSLQQAREHLAQEFRLTPEEITQLLPSGQQAVFANRVAWAKVYLQRAGLLTGTRRGHFLISAGGAVLLAEKPPRIDIKLLSRFPEFEEFRSRREDTAAAVPAAVPDVEPSATPEETLDAAHQRIRAAVATELLERLGKGTPRFFERVVVELLEHMGYGGPRMGAGQVVGRVGDEGIDGVINEDRLGLDVIYLQAKKWDGTVGRPEVQKFVGALHGKRARKGVFITTSSFSAEARDYVTHIDPRVVLIDGRQLADLMIDFDLGVATTATYAIKRVDSDYFSEE